MAAFDLKNVITACLKLRTEYMSEPYKPLSDDISRLILQEQRLRFPHFNEADAWQLGSLLYRNATALALPVVIDIRQAGRQMFYAALAGSDADNPEWARRKINVVLRYHKSSYRFGCELAQKGTSLGPDRGVDPLHYAPHGGGFPINIAGSGVIGAVAVSGLPQRDDHNFVVEALCSVLNQPHDELKLAPQP
jgi:uncharacterized protein (UPF0303 family)